MLNLKTENEQKLEKNNNKWIEKLSDLSQNWFLIVSKKPCFIIDKKNLNFFKTENRILYYCRDKEKSVQIKSKISLQIQILYYYLISLSNILHSITMNCNKLRI